MNDVSVAYQLFDTQSPMTHGVSTQTGAFNTYIPIASLLGNNGRGPELDINLFYSPDMRDPTFNNWALRFTHYFQYPVTENQVLDEASAQTLINTNTLYLSTGEAWKNNGGAGEKVSPNFTALIPASLISDRAKPIIITHKDGVVEELEYQVASVFVPGKGVQLAAYYVLKRRISPSGHALTLKWVEHRSAATASSPGLRVPRLKSIADESGELLTVDYFDNCVTFSVYPQTSRSYTCHMEAKDNQLIHSYVNGGANSRRYSYVDPLDTERKIKESKNLSKEEQLRLSNYLKHGLTLKLKTLEHGSGRLEALTYEVEGAVARHMTTSSSGGVKHSDIHYVYGKKDTGFTTTAIEYVSGNKAEYYFDANIQPIKEVLTAGSEIRTIETQRKVENNELIITTVAIISTAAGKNRKDTIINVFDFLGNLIRSTENDITTEWTYQGKFTAKRLLRTETFTDTSGVWGKFGWLLDHSNMFLMYNKYVGKQGSGLSWGTREIYNGLQPSNITYNLPFSIGCPEPSNPLRVFVESQMVHTVREGKRVNLSWTFYGYRELPVKPNSGVNGPDIKPGIKLTIYNPVSMPNFVTYGNEMAVPDNSIKLKFPDQKGLMIVEETYYDTDVKSLNHGRIIRSSQGILNPNGKGMPDSMVSTSLTYKLTGETLSTTTLTTINGLSVSQTQVTDVHSGDVLESIDKLGNKTTFEYDNRGRITRKTGFANEPKLLVTSTVDYIDDYNQPQKLTAVRHTPSIGERTQEIYNDLGQLIRSEQLHSDGKTWLIMSSISYDPLGREAQVTDHDYRPDGKKLSSLTRNLSYGPSGALSRVSWGNGTVETFEHDPVARQSTHSTLMGSSLTKTVTSVSAEPNGGQKHQAVVYLNEQRLTARTSTYDIQGRLTAESSADTLGRQYTYDQFNRVTHITTGDVVKVNEYPAHTPIDLATATSILVGAKNAGLGATRSLDDLGRITSTTIGGRKTLFLFNGTSNWGKGQPARNKDLPQNRNIRLSSTYNPASGVVTQTSKGSVGAIAVPDKTVSYTYSLGGSLLMTADEFGIITAYEYDEQGRLTGTRNNTVEHKFNIDTNGLLASETLTHLVNKRAIKTTYSYDKLNREIQRKFDVDGIKKLTLKQTYKDSVRLASMEVLDDKDKSLRHESFAYNVRGQLITYTCTGPNAPVTRGGIPIQKQVFEYDTSGNSTTRSVNTKHLERNVYADLSSTPDATMAKQSVLSSVGGDQTLEINYDAYGFRSKINGQPLTFNASGQLVTSDRGYHYEYDSSGRLSGCYGKGYSEQFHYKGGAQYARSGTLVIGTIVHERTCVLLNSSDACVMQQQTLKPAGGKADTSYSFEIKDIKGSVIASYDLTSNVSTVFAYTPFGYRPNDVFQRSWIGFNGEPMDRTSDYYHLGNGVRVYDPVNQYFLSPDIYSPFGKGGANSRSYCANDPVNYSDPSGHAQVYNTYAVVTHEALAHNSVFQAIVMGGIGIALAPFTGGSSLSLSAAATGLAVLSAGFGIASAALEENNPELSRALGFASFGTGLAGAGAGVGLGGARVASAGLRGASTSSKLGSRLVTMSGTMRSVEQVEGELYTFVDTYKTVDRLNIAVHGKDLSILERALGRNSSVILNNAEHSASDVLALLKGKGIDPSSYENIRLLVCYSGNGGGSSFAAQFAQLTQRPVKAFMGPVTMNYGSSSMAGIFTKFSTIGPGWEQVLANEFAENISHNVIKNNPYTLRSSPGRYMNFRYSPVYFR